ncbi:MAG: hypothetical protein IJA70_09590 [Oscillospiraceae bacterium]|nr:hypothetical protein [Oscillospiraceae bacterium]
MEKTREMFKKLLMLFVAAVLVFCGATEAFADESTDSGNLVLEENKEEFDFGETNAVFDYSVLERQITVAIALDEHGYTAASWDVLEKTLDNAIMLLDNAESQQEITDTADELQKAVSALVPMDYSKLEKSLGLLYGKIDENSEVQDVWVRVSAAVEKSKGLLLSGDQAFVDSAVAELEALLEEIENIPAGEPETIIKEVEVQVPPSDDFCNIPGHKIWPVLFFISLAINAALAVLIGYVFSKMKNSEDNIPLVGYDIDDDIDGMDDSDDYMDDDFAEDYENEAFADGDED